MDRLYKRIGLAIGVSILVLTVSVAGYGQTSPFDLKFKLTEEERAHMPKNPSIPADEVVEPLDDVTIDQMKETDIVTDTESNNEPDALRIDTPALASDTSSIVPGNNEELETPTSNLATTTDDVIPVVDPKPTDSPAGDNRSIFLFLMLIAATILTTLTIASNKSLVNNILRAVLNDNYLNLMYREHKKSGVSHYYILYFVFAVNAGLFLYFMLSNLVLNDGLPMLWRCVFLISIIYVIRHLFMSYLAHVYPFQKELEQYAFTILIFNIFLGLVLLPINVFIAFSPEPIESLFLYGGMLIAGMVYIFRQLRGIFIGSRLLINNKFYFLLYLCAVEIAPVILLVKYAGAYVS